MSRSRISFIPFLFDLYLAFSVFTVFTGGIFLPAEWQSVFGSHPKSFRIVLNLISIAALLLTGFFHVTGRLKHASWLASYLIQRKWMGIYWVLAIYLWSSVTLSASSVLRHMVFESSFDFAIFAQAIWNTWKGHFLYSSIKGGICLLGDHVSPILALFAPLYGLWKDPSVLLVFQACASASAIFPIYLIAKHELKQARWSLLFVIAFALYAPVRNAVRFDFHPEVIGDPLFLWAFYFIVCRHLAIASMFLVFVLMTKEVACGPVAMLGLYSFVFRGFKWFGLGWFLTAVTVFVLDVRWFAPHFSGQEYFYLSGNYLKWQQEGLGAFLGHIFNSSSFNYLKKIFVPLAFLSWLSPSHFLLTLPILAQNLLASGEFPRSTYFQYTSFLTSTTFISAIYGFKNLLRWIENKPRWCTAVAYLLIGASVLNQGTPEVRMIRDLARKNQSHFEEIRTYLKLVPEDWAVRTHLFFASHLAMRHELHIYENGHPREGGSPRAQNAEYVIIDTQFLEGDSQGHLRELKNRGYEIVKEINGLWVLQK